MVRRRELKLPNKKTAVITADDVSGSHSNNSLASLSFVSKLAKKGLEDNFIKVCLCSGVYFVGVFAYLSVSSLVSLSDLF